jgi:hypothetical protein
MKKILFLILFMSFIMGAVSAQQRDFYIEIFPKKESVRKGEIFTVVTSIMNATAKEQRICFWTCSYDQNWRLIDSSGNLTIYGTECDKNFVSCMSLQPFERLEKELYLQVFEEAKEGKVTFKLAFMPCISREECFETENENPETFLTQEVTVTIK